MSDLDLRRRSDQQLLLMAIRKGWTLSPEQVAEVAEAMYDIATGKIPTRGTNRVLATQALLKMIDQQMEAAKRIDDLEADHAVESDRIEIRVIMPGDGEATQQST